MKPYKINKNNERSATTLGKISYNNNNILNVILVAFYGDRWIHNSIRTLRFSTKNRIHLILVDNAGNSCIDDLDLSSFDTTILKCKKTLGFAEANNYALINGGLRGEYICFLNQDTQSSELWIDTSIEVLANNPEIGAITPLIESYDHQGWDPNFLQCAFLSDVFRHDLNKKNIGSYIYLVPRIPAVAMITKTDVIKETGPFDPIYESYYEDYDLCERIQNAGYKIAICSKGRIAHYSGSATNDWKKEKKRTRQIIRNRAIMDIRYSRDRKKTFLQYMAVNFPIRFARSILKTKTSQHIDTVLGAWKDLIKLYPRLKSLQADKKAWKKYLSEINWPDHSASTVYK